ncbi:MAG: hypothetical protein V9G08_09425 [Dermatophilaceae bacterium]
MEPTRPDVTELTRVVADLQKRVGRLEAELAGTKRKLAEHGPVPFDTILAITGAVAAYLGKKATVRQIHYSSGASWTRSGRSAIHRSHAIDHRSTHTPPVHGDHW